MPDAATILRDYLNDIRRIRGTGQAVPETSYYGKMEALFTAVGDTLKPSVFCVLNVKNRGAGIPDGGLFAENQQNVRVEDRGFGQLPARGVIEAKSTSADVDVIARSPQVAKYLDEYGQVLVTNFYQFVLVTKDSLGNAMFSDTFSLASSEAEFWNARVKDIVDEHADGLMSFLQHVMMSAAPISEPKDLAGILAFYAREAKRRIEQGNVDLERLQEIKADFEGALGITFEGRKGENFFRSTLVQTLFYGIFSAWVLWHETPRAQQENATFDWRLSPYLLHVPVIRGLVERLAMPTRVRDLGLEQVLQWTEDGINRVNRRAFFEKFNTGEAIQYFYEPFLEAFDPELREELGVWYTPTEVIRYMVERVDRVLRDELGRPDGLADKDVYILDPATGTGAYLVAVLERIYQTQFENNGEDAAKQAVKDAIHNVVGEEPTGRVFGFELLPAPFVVAHLQLGLLLQKYGVPLESDEERVGVYLTNSLTGWQPPEDKPKQLVIEAMKQERDQADTIKRKRKILVVLGNPPYNAFSGTSTAEENIAQGEGLVDKYKAGLRETWGIRKFNLDDLYIRFIRIAERVIAEQNGEGVVCYITNFSYLNYPSFVVMRQHLLEQFDHFWFDNLNGDSRETGKKTPDGRPDPSVFSTDFNRAGIRKGTAIGLMVRKNGARPVEKTVRYREFWGVSKRADLLASLTNGGTDFDATYSPAQPRPENRYSFAAWDVSNDYLDWPLLVEFANEHYNGPVERRGLALIDIDRSQLELRIKKYFDPSITDEEINQLHPKLMMTGNRIVGPDARKKIQSEFTYDPTRIVRYPFKPFDIRWCYLENLRPLFSEPSPDLIALQEIEVNRFFVTRSKSSKSDEGIPFLYSSIIIDYDTITGHARHFPVFIYHRPARSKKQAEGQQYLFDQFSTDEPEIKANLSQKARAYLAALGIHHPDSDPEAAALIWRHALAIGYSPAYLEEHEEGIKNDWPRIPLPNDTALLYASAGLGAQVADLLDTEKSLLHITAGGIRDDLRLLGRQHGHDLAVRANWGYADSRGAVMPGGGDARQRTYTDEEREAIERGAAALNIELDAALTLLGDTTYDLYLNETTCWSNVPANVYGYTIGGYQVIKKWLSYRNFDVLGRALTGDEVREVTQMVRRLAALILLEPQLNNNYRDVKSSVYDWGQG
jgi:hypothetical protein